jgi:hypothetical protein
VQSRHGATETAGQLGITIKLLDIAGELRREKGVSRYVHLIPGSKQHMIHATLTAVVEGEDDLVPHRFGFVYTASRRNLDPG